MKNFSFELQRFAIYGTEGNDSIRNTVSGVQIYTYGGNDTVYNYNGDYSYIELGDGNDSLYGYDNGGVTVDAGAGNDTLTGSYYSSRISAGAGSDYLSISSSSNTIYGGAGSDYISIRGGTVDGGDDADTIYAYYGSIDGGAGADRISLYSDIWYGYNTVKGGTGNDTIYGNGLSIYGNLYQYASGDGNDTIYGFTTADTLHITSGSYSTTKSGNDFIVNVGSGSVVLKNALADSYNKIHLKNSSGTVAVYNDVKARYGTSGADTLVNPQNNSSVAIYAQGGNDSIYNCYGSSVTIDAGTGNDSIYNYGYSVTIDAGAGNDFITSSGDNVTIDAGDGNDDSENSGSSVTIDAGAGADTIRSYYSYSSLNGGAGDDVVSLYSYYSYGKNTLLGGTGDDTVYLNSATPVGTVYVYNNGDGSDTIYNVTNYDTVSIGGASYSTATSGNNFIISVGSGKMTFVNGSDKSFKIIGDTVPAPVEIFTTGNDKYANTVGNTVLSALAGNDSIVNSASNVTIYGEAGSDTLTNSASKVYMNGGVGVDKISLGTSATGVTMTGGAGTDSIWTNGKGNLILYGASNGKDIISGFGGSDSISVSGAIGKSLQSGSNVLVTVGSGTSNVITVKNVALENLSVSGGVITFSTVDSKVVSLTSGADNYTNTVVNATIYALAGNDTIRNYNNYVTINAGDGADEIFNGCNYVMIDAGSGNDYINDDSNYTTINAGDGADIIFQWFSYNLINGGAGADIVSLDSYAAYYSGYGKNTISGGTGNDTVYLNSATTVGNVYVYNSGDGSDTIYNVTKYDTVSIGGASYSTQLSGNNLIVSVGSGKMTFINAKDTAFKILPTIKPVEIFTTGNDKYSNTTANTMLSALAGNDSIVNSASNVTIYGEAGNDTLKNSANKVYIDGGAGIDRISLSSSAQAVTIAGGAGNDYISLSSSKGNVVLYNAGDGNDTVYGIGTGNTLKVTGAEYSTAKSGADMVVSVSSGKVVLKNAASLDVYIDGTETVTTPAYPRTLTSGADNATISVSSVYLDAGAGADKISIGSGASNVTVYGGKGNDTIYSNGGGNIFVYAAGDGNDSITGTSAKDTLKITSGTYSLSGSTVSVYSGDTFSGKITFKNTLPEIIGTLKPEPEPEYPMSLTTGADTKTISDDNATVYALAGNDTLKITGSDGYFDGGAGTDRISLGSTASGVTISGGAGTDYLYTNGAGNLIQYASGNGKDTIYNFGGEDSIQIASGTVSMKQSSDNVLVTVNGSAANVLTLKNIALENLSVKGGVITYTDEPVPPDPGDYPKNLTSGNDSLAISDDNATVYALAGRDSITITGNEGYIDGGDGVDYLYNEGNVVTLLGGAGNDTIISEGDASTIDGGAGADSISIGAYVTGVKIIGGTGADIIHTNGGGNIIQYRSGDGNDIVYGFDGEDSISIFGADAKITTSGSDAVISVGSSKITLKDHRDTNFQNKGGIITIGDSKKFLPLTDRVNTSVFGSEYNGYIIDAMGGNDLITLDGAMEISINGGKGNDRIFLDNLDSNNNTIVGGAGDDTIYTNDQQNIIQYAQGDGDDIIRGFGKSDSIQIISGAVTSTVWSGSSMVFEFASGSISLRDVEFEEFEISKGDDNLNIITNKTSSAFKNGTYDDDEITNTTAKVIIKALDGNDLITNKSAGNNVKISAGEGNDTIISYSNSTTLSGGTGDDTISLAGGTHNNLIQYAAGDGLDVVYGFGGKDSIKVSSGTKIAAATSGSDVQITVGADDSNVITLKNVALANLKIDTANNLITARSSNGLWFTDDDINFISTENNLDAISAVEFAVTGVASAGADIYPVDFISIASADK